MYKWIWNFLRITGKPERVKELKEKANIDGGVFNFEAFVPVDREDRRYFSTEEGVNDEYRLKRWRHDHWGVESNAVDGEIKDESPESILYAFKTARAEWYDSPAKVARALRTLYPDLEIVWECCGERKLSNADITFDYYDENGGLLKTLKDPSKVIYNRLLMDAENIEKFRNLYPNKRKYDVFRLSRIIPEPDNESEEWMDYNFLFNVVMRDFDLELDGQWNLFFQKDDIGPALAAWRYENWGTPSEAMYEEDCGVFDCHLDYAPDSPEKWEKKAFKELVEKGICFYTLAFPPFKIYQKMAADGLVFKVKWTFVKVKWTFGYGDRTYDSKWSHGEGQVVGGRFRYEAGPITSVERKLIEKEDVFRLSDKDSYQGEQIIVRNRKHLDQLLECVRDKIVRIFESLKNKERVCGLIPDDLSLVGENLFRLDKPFDLSFLDVSRVTDMSGLFEGFEVSFFHYKPDVQKRRFKCRCQIKLDISRWDVSNVTKMTHMFDGCENVDFGDLSHWNRSKVKEC